MKNRMLLAALLLIAPLCFQMAHAADTGRVGCTAPNYTPLAGYDGNLSVDCAGNLRVSTGSGSAGTPSGGVQSVQGVAGGTAVPVSATTLPLPTGAATAANQTSVIAAHGASSTSAIGVQGVSGGIPISVSPGITGTPLTCSATGSSSADLTCTLSGAASKTTYINGFQISCQIESSTAASTTATLAGIITGTQTYQISEVTTALSASGRIFTQPVPASAPNTAIVITLMGIVGGTACSLNAEGFQL